MMRKFIACKFVSVIICFCVVVSLINVGIIAYANNGKACSIKIDTVWAMPEIRLRLILI